MEELFIKPYEFEKKANKKRLSNNVLQWQNEILESLYQQYPELANYPQAINYLSKDDEKLNAAGGIEIAGKIIVPFIVEERNLKPMLVYYPSDGKVTDSMPLSSLTISNLLSSGNFYKKLAPKTRVGNGVGITKTSSILDGIDGTVREEDKLALLKELEDPSTKALLHVKKASYVIDRISNIKTALEATFNKKASADDVEDDVHYIYKKGSLGWVKMSGSSLVYAPKVTELREIDVNPETDQLVKTSGKVPDKLEKLAEVSGTIITGNKEYEIIPLDKKLCKKSAVLVDSSNRFIDDFEKDAEWNYSGNTVSHKKHSTIDKGDFVLIKTSSHEYCGPVYVNSAFKMKGGWNISGVNEGLTKVAFIEDSRLANTVYHGSEVYVPKVEFIKLAEAVKLKKNFNKKAYKNNYIAKRNDEYYTIGPAFEKLSQLSGNSGPYDVHNAVFNLLQLNASEELVTKVASLKNNSEMVIEEELRVPIKLDALEEHEKKASTLLSDFIRHNFRGLIKEAAATGNEETLDAVLGLNLLNEDNMSFILDNIPAIDFVLNILSKLWLMRLGGFREVDEAALLSIITKLVQIRDILINISNNVKR